MNTTVRLLWIISALGVLLIALLAWWRGGVQLGVFQLFLIAGLLVAGALWSWQRR